jgi:hypothetical protein
MPHCLILIQSLVFALSREAGGVRYISIYLRHRNRCTVSIWQRNYHMQSQYMAEKQPPYNPAISMLYIHLSHR